MDRKYIRGTSCSYELAVGNGDTSLTIYVNDEVILDKVIFSEVWQKIAVDIIEQSARWDVVPPINGYKRVQDSTFPQFIRPGDPEWDISFLYDENGDFIKGEDHPTEKGLRVVYITPEILKRIDRYCNFIAVFKYYDPEKYHPKHSHTNIAPGEVGRMEHYALVIKEQE